MIVEEDPDPDVSYLDQDELADRRSAYLRREFSHVGVRVEADVYLEETEQGLRSPGLWGVESDLTEDELAQIVEEEWGALRSVLKAVGVSTTQLPLEVDPEWPIERRT